jgi:hypothetical protein
MKASNILMLAFQQAPCIFYCDIAHENCCVNGSSDGDSTNQGEDWNHTKDEDPDQSKGSNFSRSGQF